MNVVASILILLSNQGHWFGGQTGTITIQWTTESQPADATINWELKMDEVHLANGRLDLHRDGKPASLALSPPKVRARTTLRWHWSLRSASGEQELSKGALNLQVYPDNLLADLAPLVTDKRVLVWDRTDGLVAVLAQEKIPHERIEQASELQLVRGDLVLVGPDQLDSSPFSQSVVTGQAGAGASVMVFAQSHPTTLAGYQLAKRRLPISLEWKLDHPLLRGFRSEDIADWTVGREQNVLAIQLPEDEPVLEIVYWPRETPGTKPVPIDVLLMSKTIGTGRLVLCQMPLEDWRCDPRSQLLLGNALSHLCTRVEPTLRPSERLFTSQPQTQPVPAIVIPRGDLP